MYCYLKTCHHWKNEWEWVSVDFGWSTTVSSVVSNHQIKRSAEVLFCQPRTASITFSQMLHIQFWNKGLNLPTCHAISLYPLITHSGRHTLNTQYVQPKPSKKPDYCQVQSMTAVTMRMWSVLVLSWPHPPITSEKQLNKNWRLWLTVWNWVPC